MKWSPISCPNLTCWSITWFKNRRTRCELSLGRIFSFDFGPGEVVVVVIGGATVAVVSPLECWKCFLYFLSRALCDFLSRGLSTVTNAPAVVLFSIGTVVSGALVAAVLVFAVLFATVARICVVVAVVSGFIVVVVGVVVVVVDDVVWMAAAAASSNFLRRSFSFSSAIFRKYWWFVFSGVRQLQRKFNKKENEKNFDGNAQPYFLDLHW